MTVDAMQRLGIDPDAIEAALAADLTFPARWYSDPAIYQFELERIFTRSWQIVARLDQLERPGDHVVARVAHVPVVIVRGEDMALRGFVNVCRHRAYPVAVEDGCRKTLQCRYHAWTYGLDGSLRSAPRCEHEPGFDRTELSLVPVAVDTWGPFVWANPDPEAAPLAETHPALPALADAHGVDFAGYAYHSRWSYDIPANWKVWIENASECYHCPTIHSGSFSDAWDVGMETYAYVNEGRVLGQFTEPNPRAREFPHATEEFRYLYVWPTTFVVLDEHVAFAGVITPTGPETCSFYTDMYVRDGADPALVESWVEMYNRTLVEDAEAVLIQQPGLRSQMVPHGRLMPASESAISCFHRMVWEAYREALDG